MNPPTGAATLAAIRPLTDEHERIWWVCVYCQQGFKGLLEAVDHVSAPG